MRASLTKLRSARRRCHLRRFITDAEELAGATREYDARGRRCWAKGIEAAGVIQPLRAAACGQHERVVAALHGGNRAASIADHERRARPAQERRVEALAGWIERDACTLCAVF